MEIQAPGEIVITVQIDDGAKVSTAFEFRRDSAGHVSAI
jgi:hypothetical protein